MHDPLSLFQFQEHDIFEPFQVFHELDKNKKGTEESARNAREASRLLRRIVTEGITVDDKGRLIVENGFPLSGPSDGLATGRLYLQDKHVKNIVSGLTNGHEGDDFILSAVKHAQEEMFPDREVIFVTKDSNALIKAVSLKIRAEDYKSDEIRVVEDSSLIRTGVYRLPEDFWNRNECDEIDEDCFKIRGDILDSVMVNEFVLSGPTQNHIPRMASVVDIKDGAVILKAVPDFSGRTYPRIYGIRPRNQEQNLALSLLMDPEIDLVTILGRAGSGKTLLAVAASLHQVLVSKIYTEIVFTRANIPIGRDSGFLPGTEREKQLPLMGGLLDNLEVVVHEKMMNPSGRRGGTVASSEMTASDILNKVISVKDMSLMRGRSFARKIVIFDEVQNMTRKQVKAALTRVGEGSKAICLGNLAQIDTPYLTEASSGLTYLANQFASWPHSGHIILEKCTRSRLAYYAEEML
ncbi:MAG: PhoH family protein [Candidatus Moranbacteria bacterium]|nr:PhoH family protein [Candidatus Moranbacteria bacterium]